MITARRHPRITGLGAVSPYGIGMEKLWSGVLEGRTALAPPTRFDTSTYRTRLAGEATDFDREADVPRRLLPQTDRITRFALVASDEALGDARHNPATADNDRLSVVTATTGGGFEFAQKELQSLCSEGPLHVTAYQSFAWFYAVNSGQISIRHSMRGPARALVSDDAGGLDSLGHGRRLLRSESDLVLAGAVDSALCPWGWAAYGSAGMTSVETAADRAYRPFASDAGGFIPGEGGAILAVETPGSARRRPAYAEFTGFASGFAPDGEGPGATIAAALDDAGLGPEQIDLVFADGYGDVAADAAERDSLVHLFGPRGVPVTVPKALFGRFGAGSGSTDVALACRSIQAHMIPPTPSAVGDSDTRLDFSRTAIPADLDHVLVVNRGAGGYVGAAILSSPPTREGMTMQETDIIAIVEEVAGHDEIEIGGRTADEILATRFDELGFDSIAVIEVLNSVRREHGLLLDDDLERLAAPADVLEAARANEETSAAHR